MANDTIALALLGRVSLEAYSKAIQHLFGLVGALSQEVAEGAEISWVVDSLEVGSALTVIRGDGEVGSIERVVSAYGTVGRSLEVGSQIPYSRRVVSEARAIVSLIDQELDSVRFETPEIDATITLAGETPVREAEGLWQAYGAVEGRVQTLTSRGGLRFTLYDTLFDRSVSCYLAEGSEDVMRGAWGRRAVVEGLVRREPSTGRPTTVRQVGKVTVLPELARGSYLQARGALAWPAGDPLPEQVIRRHRDA